MAQNVKPRFEVEELEGTRMMMTCRRDKEKATFIYEMVEVPAGFMVYFPQGHSLRLDEAEMKRRGFFGKSGLVDMDSGELIEDVAPISLKETVRSRTKDVRVRAIPLE